MGNFGDPVDVYAATAIAGMQVIAARDVVHDDAVRHEQGTADGCHPAAITVLEV